MKQVMKAALRGVGVKRHHVAAARMLYERQFLAATKAQPAPREHGRILALHSVGQPSAGVNDVSAAQLIRYIELALEWGYRFVPASEIASAGGASKDLAITFDDAWASVLYNAAPILRDFGIPWTIFVVTDWAFHGSDWHRQQFLSWRELSLVERYGGEIGSHSMTHPDFAKLLPAQIVQELRGSREAIRRELGFTPESFAVPFGQSMNWTEEAQSAAEAAGYKFIYAQAESTRCAGTVARTFITKFDDARLFKAALHGAYDQWEEWC